LAKTNLITYLPNVSNSKIKQREDQLKTSLALLFLLVSTNVFAAPTFYPADFASQAEKNLLKDEALKAALNKILTTNHLRSNSQEADTLGCPTAGSGNCYNQIVLGYDGARKIMFGKLFLKQDGNGNYITDVYCQKRFGPEAGVAPGSIPNGVKINCEHTWPQSKFTNSYPIEMQKSDLHHIFPSDSKANSIRGNDDFVNVGDDNGVLASDDCTTSKFGSSNVSSNDGFEPPLTHKGNVARALFYFSVHYKMPLGKAQEEVLRRWNDLDPVDQEEIDRNNAIYAVQGNRNPFIDFPGLANNINKF